MTILPHQPYGVVYVIHNLVSNGVYIGITRGYRINKRWTHHRWALTTGVHENPHLQRSWKRYGADAFEFTVLEEHESQEDLDNAERFYIAYLRSIGAHLYNLKEGGGFGGSPSLESRRKMSLAGKGRKLSAETRQRMSDGMRGKPKPPRTEAHREKLGIASRERQSAASYREWRRQITLGLKRTDEARQNMSEAQAQRFGVTYHLTDPDGVKYAVTNLTQFCQEHGLNKSSVKNLFNGPNRVAQYRGWTGYKT